MCLNPLFPSTKLRSFIFDTSFIDWYHEDSYTNLEQYMNEDNLDGVEPIPRE